MRNIDEAMSRVGLAVSCAQEDKRHRREHLEAALSATGDLQRALILEQLAIKPKPDGTR